MSAVPSMPLRYSPGVETPEPDEAKVQAELVETLLKISRITYEDGGHALRSVHAKAHGLLQATLTVANGLPPELAQGLFAAPARYPVAMRFSTSAGDLLPDSVSLPRGLALKVMDIPGEMLAGSEGVQDFLLVTGKAFLVPNAKKFLGNLKLLTGTTDKAEGLKVALSAVLRGTETAIEALGGESPKIKSLGGYPEIHILGESFFSQVPIRFGDYIAKIGVVPVSPGLKALVEAPLDLNHDPNALRAAMRDFFASQGGVWEMRVQLCTGLDDMPVEDASVPWPEDKSPYITVATLEAPAQDAFTQAAYEKVDTAMAFSPWHGLAAHQPLGGIMRARKAAYEASAKFRLSNNGCPFHKSGA
jgi:hypothetical protein